MPDTTAGAITASSPAPSASPPPASAPPAADEKLIAAINEASKRELTNWFTFLTLGTYLAVAVGATTHRQLFLEQPVKLPLFNVDLPLVAFFIVAPALFVIMHFYVLLQLQMLTGRVRAAIADLAGSPDRDVRLLAFGRRLDTFFVSQLLVVQDDRLSRLALYAITWITLIAAPVLLLLIFQLSFLPYHDERVTWIHRALIGAGLLLVCFLEPRLPNVLHILRRRWDPFRIPTRPSVSGVIISLAIAIIATFVATIPDEAIERRVGSIEWVATLRSQIFSDGIDLVRGRPEGLFARRLVLNDQDFVDLSDAALAMTERTVVLRGRDLRLAVLDRTDLRKADFTAADLRGASLIGARLDAASFGCARDPAPHDVDDFAQRGRPGCTRIDDARFDGATAPRARFDWVSARRARFISADLAEAGFWRADLTLTDFTDAKLQGARMSEARIVGASFVESCAIGIDLREASGFAARFNRADFRGARLGQADLALSAWDDADLRGTELRLTYFAGSTLVGTDLRGAALGSRGLDALLLRGARLEESWIDDPPGVGVLDLGEREPPMPSRLNLPVAPPTMPACERFAAQVRSIDVAKLVAASPGLVSERDPPTAAARLEHWKIAARAFAPEHFVQRLLELATEAGACGDDLREAFDRRASAYDWGVGGIDVRSSLRKACSP
ncbi:MAG: pentapeptide repeat-containing protein [Alphaproteobacteria bacterium]|nr:pentapeptide repeat-containing protein [Alphaproteobacteria bacterium]